MIYPVDSVIQCSNNQGLFFNKHPEYRYNKKNKLQKMSISRLSGGINGIKLSRIIQVGFSMWPLAVLTGSSYKKMYAGVSRRDKRKTVVVIMRWPWEGFHCTARNIQKEREDLYWRQKMRSLSFMQMDTRLEPKTLWCVIHYTQLVHLIWQEKAPTCVCYLSPRKQMTSLYFI